MASKALPCHVRAPQLAGHLNNSHIQMHMYVYDYILNSVQGLIPTKKSCNSSERQRVRGLPVAPLQYLHVSLTLLAKGNWSRCSPRVSPGIGPILCRSQVTGLRSLSRSSSREDRIRAPCFCNISGEPSPKNRKALRDLALKERWLAKQFLSR